MKEEIKTIPVDQLHSFKNHPFKVRENSELFQLIDSIESEGILNPLILRPRKDESGYEIISGHRRHYACMKLGIKEVPAVVRELDDDQAVLTMVDSNLSREKIFPSEKAFAYKMRYEALKHQGQRTDLTASQTETQYEGNPTVRIGDLFQKGIRGDEILARQVGESRATIQRYIRLTNLIPKLLDKVDEEVMALSVGVELSYLTEEEQYEVLAVMDYEECTPSLSQAGRLKRLSRQLCLDMDAIYSVMEELKPNQKEVLKIKASDLQGLFPEEYSEQEKVDLIKQLLQKWSEAQGKKRHHTR